MDARQIPALAVALLLAALAALVAACAPVPPSTTASPGQPSRPVSPAAAVPGASPGTPAPFRTPDLSRARFSTAGWKTDFTRHSVPLEEISSGGPPRDGIPPLDRPTFEAVEQADRWLAAQEPVIAFAVGGDARAYPLQILVWHEIVNDEVGGVPVVVTFCPLCNTAIAFDRRLDDRVLDFGTTGNLRHSDLVMWDRQTESWWQQVTGEAIVGELTGRQLQFLPAAIVAWEDFRHAHPQGRVLSRDTGYSRDYGRNPYPGYDRVDQPPFLFEGAPDGRLPPKERVVAVSLGGEAVAYPFADLRERRVVADRVGGQPVVVFYQPGAQSPLDRAQIAGSRDVGAAAVYRPEVDGRPLSFTWQEGQGGAGAFVDAETGSHWTLLGQATAGPLAGKELTPVVHGTHFWFAFAAFYPQLRVWSP